MTVNEIIRNALLGFGDPVVSGEYTNPTPPPADAERYYSLNISTYGSNFADDEPNHEIALIMVHFFCPRDYDTCERVKQTKRALFAAGTTWPEMIPAYDDNGQHIVFECKLAKGVDE